MKFFLGVVMSDEVLMQKMFDSLQELLKARKELIEKCKDDEKENLKEFSTRSPFHTEYINAYIWAFGEDKLKSRDDFDLRDFRINHPECAPFPPQPNCRADTEVWEFFILKKYLEHLGWKHV